MGRPPCCDKVGIKKGPWTPEEDIILVSYIQQHGPGNWRSVPTNTGLLRCSKSCRLRWTNYLRPGIKRGNFTPHEEGMIVHLQALLGNKWAAIASYLPQRTDNDIKNYWNTHLKKKLKKLQSAPDPHSISTGSSDSSSKPSFLSRNFSTERSSAPRTDHGGGATTYASSAENISRLLEGWMRSSPNTNNKNSLNLYRPEPEQEGANLMPREEFDSMLSFDNINNLTTWEKSSCDSGSKDSENADNYDEKREGDKVLDAPRSLDSTRKHSPQLSVLEKWLLDESTSQVVDEMMELDPIF